ncbi:MAG: zf-HC2 domain-containing protein [Gemmatimonadota bacterium]|nr:zf-HC2 domain-containing protein [Gemmatimonadota bacterium]
MTVEDDGVHVDEGIIHAWLDGQLDDEQAARLQAHVARCGACAAHVAEARGLVAGASRVVGMLDETPSPTVRPALTPTAGTDLSVWRLLRVTPARASIAAMLVVAVGIVLTRGHLARDVPASSRVENAALRVRSDPAAMAAQMNDTVLGSAIARRLAAEQPPRQVEPAPGVDVPGAPAPPAPRPNADLADAQSKVVAGRASVTAQREMAAPSADRTRAGVGQLDKSGTMATGRAQLAAKAADMAGSAAPSANRIAAFSGIAAGECYRVESADPATWGSVQLPMIVALDSTGVEARILSPNGSDTHARAYLQHNGADSALFRLRRIGFSGSMTLLPSTGVRTGTLRSSAQAALEEVGVTSAPSSATAPAPRALSRSAAMSAAAKPSATASSLATITARRVACPATSP